jgi:hypothetical protein
VSLWLPLSLTAALFLVPSERSAVSARYAARIDAPLGWKMLRQSAYPNTIGVMVHRDGGKLTFSAQDMHPGDSLQAVAERNRDAMLRDGFHITSFAPSESGSRGLPLGTSGYAVEATSKDGRLELRQLYFQHGTFAYVATLASPRGRVDQYQRDLDALVRSVTFTAGKENPE